MFNASIITITLMTISSITTIFFADSATVDSTPPKPSCCSRTRNTSCRDSSLVLTATTLTGNGELASVVAQHHTPYSMFPHIIWSWVDPVEIQAEPLVEPGR
ncbi:hypothetical protein F5Y09DRAFT_336382 [Xylaria sp. FL1042]|nr:hypothetical protein F5Y09DRAFT_336382 [Xylaria sp. FL1042]